MGLRKFRYAVAKFTVPLCWILRLLFHWPLFPTSYSLLFFFLFSSCFEILHSRLAEIDISVTTRIPARPDWRIRTGFRDARHRTGTLFFFFLKHNWYLWVWPTSYNRVTISYTKLNFYFYKSELNLHVVNPYKCVGPAVCGCLLMSSPVPTRIKNPC